MGRPVLKLASFLGFLSSDKSSHEAFPSLPPRFLNEAVVRHQLKINYWFCHSVYIEKHTQRWIIA